MFKRSLVFTAIIICVLSFFFTNNISYAGPSLGTWINADQRAENAKSIMNTERDNYHYIQDDLKTLIGQWNNAKIANDNQRLLSVIAAGGAIVSVASGGSLYPAAYVVAVTAAKLTYNEATYDVQKSAYLTSMSGLLSLMDTARSNVNSAYNGGYLTKEPPGSYIGSVGYIEYTPGYVPEYNAYLQVALDHLNKYEYYQGNNYNNVVTLTLAGLTTSVKNETLKGWYHRKYHDGDENSKTDHVFEKFMTFADFVVKPDLQSTHRCKGACSDMFRTPYEAFSEHRTKCGTEVSIDLDWTTKPLSERSVEEGCGRSWYHCPSRPTMRSRHNNEFHKVRECNKLVYTYDSHFKSRYTTKDCPESYRACMGHTYDHNNSKPGKSAHSDAIDNSTPAPTPTPSYHACGIHETWQSGDHFAAACGSSGHFVCDGSNHSAAGCGTSGHYACDGSNHSQTYCYATDSNGSTCTVGNYYACQSHTHVFPAPPPTPTVTCARKACGQTVSNRLEHRVDCSNCNGHYWTCISGAANNHTTIFTCRRAGCGVTFTKCSNGTCTSNSGTHNYHWAQ